MPTDIALADQKGQSPKDPITCHVLDITTGLPAVSMSVKLEVMISSNFFDRNLPISQTTSLNARTNADGRITQWHGEEGDSVEEFMRLCSRFEQRTVWVLTFDTEGYFGEGKGFFPAVEVRFYVNNAKGSHVHVPLLIGPYSYTTYRGS